MCTNMPLFLIPILLYELLSSMRFLTLHLMKQKKDNNDFTHPQYTGLFFWIPLRKRNEDKHKSLHQEKSITTNTYSSPRTHDFSLSLPSPSLTHPGLMTHLLWLEESRTKNAPLHRCQL